MQTFHVRVQVDPVMSEIDIFVSSTSLITLDHKKLLKNSTFVGNTGHLDNDDRLSWLRGLGHQASEVRAGFSELIASLC